MLQYLRGACAKLMPRQNLMKTMKTSSCLSVNVRVRMLICLAILLATSPTRAGWTLVWSDEFNESTINPDNWTYDLGTGSGGWGNNELEYYTSRTNNVRIENGNLVIQARRNPTGGINYISARLKSQGLQSWTRSGYTILPRHSFWPISAGCMTSAFTWRPPAGPISSSRKCC